MSASEQENAAERADTSLRDGSVSGLLWTISRSGGMVGLRLLMLVILARLLTPEDFGVMNAATIVLAFSAMFYQMGVGPALVQRSEVTSDHVRAGFSGAIIMSLIFGGAVALGAPVIASVFGIEGLTPVLLVIAIEFPIKGLSVVPLSMMQRQLRFRELAIIDILSYALGYGVVGVTMAVFGAGVWALVGAHLTGTVVSAVGALIASRYGLRPGFNVTAFRELMVFGGGFTIARVFNYIAGQGDNFVAARWLGAASLGAYGRAYQLIAFPVNQLTFVIGEVLFPAMARIQTSKERLSATFRRGATFMALVFAPLGLMTAVLAPEIVAVFLGPSWSETVAPFRVLAVGMLFRAGYQMSDVLAQATGAVFRRAWRQVIYAVAVVGGSWVGQHWGLVGLAFGVLGALMINFTLMSHLSISLTSLTWRQFLKAHMPAFGIAALGFATTLGMASWLRSLDAPSAIVLATSLSVSFLSIGLLAFLRPGWLGPDQPWIFAIVGEVLGRLRHRGRPAATEQTASGSVPGESSEGVG